MLGHNYTSDPNAQQERCVDSVVSVSRACSLQLCLCVIISTSFPLAISRAVPVGGAAKFLIANASFCFRPHLRTAGDVKSMPVVFTARKCTFGSFSDTPLLMPDAVSSGVNSCQTKGTRHSCALSIVYHRAGLLERPAATHPPILLHRSGVANIGGVNWKENYTGTKHVKYRITCWLPRFSEPRF